MNLSRLQLLRLVYQKELNFQKIANVIKQDVVLSHKLLRIVNSAYYGLSLSITGILHALTILGTEGTRKWLSFVVMLDCDGDNEKMLSRMALSRGLFMESIATRLRKKRDRDMFFLFGLFSLADVLMEAPMEEVLAQTNLSPKITDALLSGEGEMAELLSILVNYERGEWDAAVEVAKAYKITEDEISQIYIESISKAYEML
jgi:EAL and modified HD-GYP domain-containing signal transduction protein